MFDPSSLRSKRMPLPISYGDIPVAAVFPTDKSGDFVDIPVLSLSRCFLSLHCQFFDISPLIGSNLPLHAPVGL